MAFLGGAGHVAHASRCRVLWSSVQGAACVGDHGGQGVLLCVSGG